MTNLAGTYRTATGTILTVVERDGRVIFEGGEYGAHSIEAGDSARARAHFAGYVDANGGQARRISGLGRVDRVESTCGEFVTVFDYVTLVATSTSPYAEVEVERFATRAAMRSAARRSRDTWTAVARQARGIDD